MQTEAKTTKAKSPFEVGEASGKKCKCGTEIRFHAYKSWVEGGGWATFVSEWCPAQEAIMEMIMKNVPTEPSWKWQETREEVWQTLRMDQQHSDFDGYGPIYN